VVSLNRAAWRYVHCARGHRIVLRDLLELPAWSEDLVGELLDLRCRETNLEPDFRRIRLPRLLDAGEYETMSERNRAGVYRLIWDIAQGSPAAAVRIWAESLAVGPDGTVVVRLPDLPTTGELETASIQLLLVLRVILQCEVATPPEIQASLRFPEAEVAGALRSLRQGGWVETVGDGCRIRDDRYVTVVGVLNRRNLIKTSAGVGVL
jgi:hypothetical protein